MKKIILTSIIFLGFITSGYCIDPPPFNSGNPNAIPIDGGALVLLGMGVGYGLKKVKDKKTES